MDLGFGDGRDRHDRGICRLPRRPDGPDRHDDGRRRQGHLPGLLRLWVRILPALRPVLAVPDRVLPVPLYLLAPMARRIRWRLLASAPARPGDAEHARFAAVWIARPNSQRLIDFATLPQSLPRPRGRVRLASVKRIMPSNHVRRDFLVGPSGRRHRSASLVGQPATADAAETGKPAPG